jgi:putative transposase
LPIAPSSYDAAVRRPASARREQAAALKVALRRFWDAHRQLCGPDEVWVRSNRAGVRVARCTVARLMRESGLGGGVRGRRSVRNTLCDEASDRPADPVARQFRAAGPDRPWVADLTSVKTHSGWVDMARIADVCSRFVVGWQASRPPRTDPAGDALEMAPWARRAGRVAGLIHHRDRGV